MEFKEAKVNQKGIPALGVEQVRGTSTGSSKQLRSTSSAVLSDSAPPLPGRA